MSVCKKMFTRDEKAYADYSHQVQFLQKQKIFTGMMLTSTVLNVIVAVVLLTVVVTNTHADEGYVLGKSAHSVMVAFVNTTINNAVSKLEERISAAEAVMESYNSTLTLLNEFLQWKKTEGSRLESCLQDPENCD